MIVRRRSVVYLSLFLFICLILSACSQASITPNSEDEATVSLIGKPYDYDLSEYLALPSYRNVHFTPLGDGQRSYVDWGDTVTVSLSLDIENTVAPPPGLDTIVIGASNFLPGFDEALIGRRISDTVTTTLRFPDSYSNPNYAGKNVTVTAQILMIDLSHCREMNENALWDIIVSESQVLRFPEKELTRYCKDYHTLYEAFAKQYRMSLDDYLQTFFQISAEDLDAECLQQAQNAVKEDMVLWAIWRDADLFLTEKDIQNCKAKWLETYGYEDESKMPQPWEDESVAESLQRMAVEQQVKSYLLKINSNDQVN